MRLTRCSRSAEGASAWEHLTAKDKQTIPSPTGQRETKNNAATRTILVGFSDHLRDLGVGKLLAQVGYH